MFRNKRFSSYSPFSSKFLFSQLSHTTAIVEDPQAKQPSSASCGVRLPWIMAEGGRRCSSSRSADKLSLLDASVPTFTPFLQSHQQHGNGAAHRAPSQQSFNNSFPPGRQAIQALMVSQCCLLEVFSFHLLPPLLLFLYSFLFFSENAWCFFHFSNLYSLLLSSLSSQTKPRGACSYSLFLLCFIFFLMTQNYPFRVSSFQPGS